MDRTWMFEMAKKSYQEGKIDKDILKNLIDIPKPVHIMYITKEEYKLITGEDWTPTAL